MTSTPTLTPAAPTRAAQQWDGEPFCTHVLSLCIDCTLIVANGETGQGDDHDAAIVAAQTIHLDDDAVRLVLTMAEPVPFSTVRCDGCGSRLAGERHAAVIL